MKIKKISIFIILLMGLILTYLFWPKIDHLPKLGEVSGVTLQSIDGTTYKFQDEKVKLVTFFYSNCPDICPMTLFDLGKLKDKLIELGVYDEEVKLISITLDPETDTVERLNEYSKLFGVDHSGWTMLRGDLESTKEVADQFRMVYEKDESGFITHTTTMYLLDGANNIRTYHDMTVGDKHVDIEEIVVNIEKLLKE